MPILEESELRHDTNEALSEMQKREIHALISKTNREIQSIDSETGDAQYKRDTLAARMKVLRAMVSHVKELPNEILAKIFVQYMQDTCPNFKGEMPDPPWFLGQICSRWRRVALSTSEVWKDFSIRAGDVASTELISSSVDETKELFRRAGQSPISLSIDLTYPTASIAHLLPLFTQNVTRLNYLKLGVNTIFQPLLELPGGTLTRLGTLVLGIYEDHDMTRSDFERATLFEGSPGLHRLSIYSYSGNMVENFDPGSLRLPWSQLTHLDISNDMSLRLAPTCELLRQCVNLIKCSLAIPNDEDIGHWPVLELGNLEMLAITNGYLAFHGRFLAHLVVPSLKQFSSLAKFHTDTWSLTHLVGMIQRSACKIETFKTRYDVPDDVQLDLLKHMPSLRRLSIYESRSFYQIVGWIAHENFLPNLQLIECVVANVSSTAVELKKYLGASGFMEPLNDVRTMLRIVFVPGRFFDVGYGGMQLMKELERNWLRVGFKKNADQDFMEYSRDEGNYITGWKDDEVSESGFE